MALYLYGFSYFLEVLLQENFESAYLEDIASKIDTMALQYRELYSAVYTHLENRSHSSIQSKLIGGVAAANKKAGQAIAKIPVISKSPLDESLIAAGEKLGAFEESRTTAALRQLVDHQSSCVRPFIDQIYTISRIYNHPMELIFDNENLYIA
ncbi:hypothetical protein [Oscillibacter valericigenes]|uniref:hypothetical protein n=1 Tax=Oscillibacter valericigenes TaxID=351091 RepID=UPI00195ABEB2|nr:hypothetical protein [Oscillibacter valericigenes]MBM6910649.1 hypothetical protein [Oscillibacter valericigenes]